MSFTLLRWSIALVLGAGAALLVVSPSHDGHAGGRGALLVLGICELIAAALFVVPHTVRAGGFALLGVLAGAVALHAAAGQWPPSSFVVYAAAIWAVMVQRRRTDVVAA